MVRLVFGQPAHGWLPLTLYIEAFELTLDVSDVPINPIEEFCNCLCLVLKGGEAAVWWHLEPTWYQFHFEPRLDKVVFSIWQAARYQRAETLIFQYAGDFASLILPFYRALKQFTSLPISEKDWPTIDQEKLRQLTELVRVQKRKY
jgi:hypothetical protein